MSIKRVQAREGEPMMKHTNVGPDGQMRPGKMRGHANDHGRTSTWNGSFREWESLNVGKVRPDFVLGNRDARV